MVDFDTSTERDAHADGWLDHCKAHDSSNASIEMPSGESYDAGWEAARQFFLGTTVQITNDHFVAESLDGDKTEIGEATIGYNDLALRQQALAYAVQSGAGENTTSHVARAKAFLEFLQKGDQS